MLACIIQKESTLLTWEDIQDMQIGPNDSDRGVTYQSIHQCNSYRTYSLMIQNQLPTTVEITEQKTKHLEYLYRR